LGVDEQVANALCRHRQNSEAGIALEGNRFVWRQQANEVGAACLEVCDAGRHVRHSAEGHGLERRPAAPIAVVGIKRDLNTLLPPAQPVGPAAEGLEIERLVADPLDVGLWHDRQLDELGEQHRIGLFILRRTLVSPSASASAT
jgi:hypothetical protein